VTNPLLAATGQLIFAAFSRRQKARSSAPRWLGYGVGGWTYFRLSGCALRLRVLVVL